MSLRPAVAALLLTLPLAAESAVFTFEPARTQVHFTLGTLLHTVHGSFQLAKGAVSFDSATGQASGEVVVNAASGESGNAGRDSRMHKSILESDKYPAIIFRPDHIAGQIPAQGSATLEVHGMFSVHGADHEMTVPVEVQTGPDQTSVVLHFTIPYIKWGMKNPSNIFLHVRDTVDVEFKTGGSATP